MAKKFRQKNKRTDVLIVVPKQDELYWAGLAFGFQFSQPDRFLPPHEEPIYDRTIEDSSGNQMRVAFVGMDSQGNTAGALIARESARFLNPSLAFLVGTALGNPKRCKVVDVVFSQHVTDVSETKALDKGPSWRPTLREPSGRMRRDVGRYRESVNIRELQSTFFKLATDHLPEQRDTLSPMPAAVHLEALATGDMLIADPGVAEKLWDHDDRLASYDMESGGFAKALEGRVPPDDTAELGPEGADRTVAQRHGSPDWMVVRGISDFGDPESKSLVHDRQIASAVAGIVLHDFLKNGLIECHPYQLQRQLYDFAFHTDGYVSQQTDVYLWGLSPQAAARKDQILTDTLKGQSSY